MADLFGKVDRTERQQLGVQKWVNNRLKGSFVYCTGFGKTRTAIMCIKRFLAKNPGRRILIVVPSDNLKSQWISQLAEHGIFANCEVQIINTVVRHEWVCDVLVLDECHKYASDLFGQVFQKVKYSAILGLTATMERLDGKDSYIKQYCPVVDKITISEATANGWLSPYREYKVLIDVDLTEYRKVNQEFYNHFSFFENNFPLAMSCVTDWKVRNEVAKSRCSSNDPELLKDVTKQVLIHAMGFNRTLQARKQFIYSHPRKVELANLILEHRQDKKCITFSPTIKIAEQIAYGQVLHSKQKKAAREDVLETFLGMKTGVLNTSKSLDEGTDIPDLSVAVILSNTSSSTQKTQRLGRVIRKAENKVAEIFTLVIKGTVEEEWFRKNNGGKEYITVGDNDLLDLLEGREFSQKKNKETKLLFRF